MLYKLLLFTHILSAIMSIGPFFVLLPVLGKLTTAEGPEQTAYVNTFRFAIQLAKHTGHVLVVSGVLLAVAGSWPWHTPWIVMTVLILVSSLFFLARAFSPKLKALVEPGQDKSRVKGAAPIGLDLSYPAVGDAVVYGGAARSVVSSQEQVKNTGFEHDADRPPFNRLGKWEGDCFFRFYLCLAI